MTTHTTLSASTQAGRKDRPSITAVLRTPTPPQTTAFLIANLELKLIVSNRKTSALKIPNRKKIAISLSPKWHRHSCLCAVARLGIPPTEAVTSLPSSFQNLIETPRLKFPATTRKLSPLPISNRDKMCTFIVAANRPSPAATALFTSHEFLSTRPKTFSASTPVLDFAQQFCSEEIFLQSLLIGGTSGSVQRFPVNPARPGREQR
jgi:hypothetical protein